jgi:tRNA(fMet)-specific endonuclease VapC
MSLRILDTDHLSLLQRRYPQVQQRYGMTDLNQLRLTIITVEEQIRGRFGQIKRATKPNESVFAYEALFNTLEYFKQMTILPFDQAAYDLYMNLCQQKVRIGRQDLKIAAIALTQNAIVITRNHRDFSQVPGLQLEDWTLQP